MEHLATSSFCEVLHNDEVGVVPNKSFSADDALGLVDFNWNGLLTLEFACFEEVLCLSGLLGWSVSSRKAIVIYSESVMCRIEMK